MQLLRVLHDFFLRDGQVRSFRNKRSDYSLRCAACVDVILSFVAVSCYPRSSREADRATGHEAGEQRDDRIKIQHTSGYSPLLTIIKPLCVGEILACLDIRTKTTVPRLF